MKLLAHALASVLLMSSAVADEMQTIAPALDKYRQERLLGEVWKRPQLSARDRSLVTLAALIARQQTVELAFYLNRALDSGVKPAEVAETITHLAFYAGSSNATAAATVANDVFAQRNIVSNQSIAPKLLPLDEKAEAQRAARVSADFAKVAPGVVQYTTEVLFRDLWLRPDLAPRDRSLVTVAALIANGQVAQMPYHLNRAMDNGLTKDEAGEVLTHLAFYIGWPNVFSALPVAKELFEKRPK